MRKFSTAPHTSIDHLLSQVEETASAVQSAVNQDADAATIYALDRQMVEQLFELSITRNADYESKRKIIEYALSKIESNAEQDTSICFYTRLIRENLPEPVSSSSSS